MRRHITKARLIVAGVVILLLTVVLGFGPLVRSRVNSVAERYGAKVEIEWVVPVWGGVSLRGVKVTHPDAPGVKVELDRVFVGMGSPRQVVIESGRAKLNGEVEELAEQFEKVRSKMPKSEGGESGGGSKVTLNRFDVLYEGPSGKLELKNANFNRDGTRFVISATAGKGDTALARGTFADGRVEIERGEAGVKLRALNVEGLELTADIGHVGVMAGPALASSESKEEVSKFVRARRSLAKVSELFDRYVVPEGTIDLNGVRAEIVKGAERFSVGPATFKFAKKDGRLLAEYVGGTSLAADPPKDTAREPPKDSNAKPPDSLSIKIPFPRQDEPLAVEMRGGPVSFSSLGIRDGELRLTDVERATFRANARFEVDPQGEVLSFDGEARVEGLSANLPQIAKDPIKNMNASFRGSVRAALDGSKISVKNGELELGRVRLATSFDATMEPPKTQKDPPRLKLDASFEVPLVPCQALLDGAPQGLLPTLEGMRLAGSFSLKGSAKFDTQKLDKDFNAQWDISSTCRVTEAPPNLNVERFTKAFRRKVYSPGGERSLEIETGPGTNAWARYGNISRYMELGVISFEDGRFRRHEGFDQEAIRNSLRENLRKWQFIRGASTISMQLAKNLYLERDKLLARKIEEAFLTMYLEQALTKEQIMELYLNVVEFGPNVYGIQAAARHYFNTAPSSLSLSQAFYLASILPAPQRQHFGAGGTVAPGWLKLLRTVMKHANKVRRITDEELAEGLAQIPVRGSPAPMRDPDAEPPPTDPSLVDPNGQPLEGATDPSTL